MGVAVGVGTVVAVGVGTVVGVGVGTVVGVGVGMGVGVGVGMGVGVGVGMGVGVGVGVGMMVGAGIRVAVGVEDGCGAAVGVAVGLFVAAGGGVSAASLGSSVAAGGPQADSNAAASPCQRDEFEFHGLPPLVQVLPQFTAEGMGVAVAAANRTAECAQGCSRRGRRCRGDDRKRQRFRTLGRGSAVAW